MTRKEVIEALAHCIDWAKEPPEESFCNGVPVEVLVTARNLLEQQEEKWIPCSERLPECEQEVLICTKVYGESVVVAPAIYEDGTMPEVRSRWKWEDIDYTGWDEEEDCGIIPEGWWENRYFNPDDVYNNPVDKMVIAWMPLPKPWEEEK